MIKIKGITRVRKGEYFKTPEKMIEELKQKYHPDNKETLERLLYKEFKWSDM